MRRTVRILLLVALGTLSAAQARTLAQARASGTLHLYTGTDFAPFSSVLGSIVNGGGVPVGFEVELGDLIAKRLGLKPVWQVKDFDALLPSIQTDPDVDLIIASHAITSTREKLVDFTQPHYCTGGVALAKPGGPLKGNAFEGRTIGAEQGSTYANFLKKLPFPVRTVAYPNSEKSYAGLLAGRVDAVLTDRFAALDAVKNHPKDKLIVGPLLWRESIGMVVAKGNDDLRLAVNRVLAELMRDGTYAKLSQRYFKRDIRC